MVCKNSSIDIDFNEFVANDFKDKINKCNITDLNNLKFSFLKKRTGNKNSSEHDILLFSIQHEILNYYIERFEKEGYTGCIKDCQ